MKVGKAGVFKDVQGPGDVGQLDPDLPQVSGQGCSRGMTETVPPPR